MRKLYLVILFISGIILTGCHNKKADLQFEKKVMYQIYPALIDSVWVTGGHPFIPPPPSDFNDQQIKEYYSEKRLKKRFNETLASLKKSKYTMGVVILDKIVSIGECQQTLKKHFKDAVISKNNIPDTLDYKIDRKKFDAYKTFALKYLSKTPRTGERKYYNEIGYNEMRGIIHFTRIQFDTKKKFGILYAGINCGDMCDNGYRIYIKKINNKWVIDKIEDAWIA